jgi:biotin carboxyl carrier protein
VASGIVESSSSSSQGNEGQGSGGAVSRSKLVQRLLATSANLPGFVNDLIHTQAVVVAGTEAAGFLIDRNAAGPDGEPAAPDAVAQAPFSLRPIAHIRPDSSTAETRAAAIQAFQELIFPCVQQGKDGAIEVGGAGDTVDPQFCLVTLLRNEGEIVAASAVITRCRDTERAQQRLTSMQLVAGYFDLYTLKRTSEQARTIAQSHQHVLQLATAVATAQGFQSAAMNLCNEMATRTSASRVSIGWVKNERVKVKALSHTEEFDKRQELIVQLERAMEECYDQEEVVQYEPDGSSSNNVTREAQALSRAQGNNSVISIPLRRQAEIIGILLLEFAPGQKLGPQAAAGLSVAAELLAPQLFDRYTNDRYLITKMGISSREGFKALIGPKHWLAKTVIFFSIAALVFLCVYSPMYRVVAPFAFAAMEKRSVDAPFEGYIKDVFVRPADKVKAGQPLFALDTADLRKELTRAMGERDSYLKQHAKYLGEKPPKVAEANIALKQAEASDAEAQLLQSKIDRATVKAEIDGEVLEGDLKDKKGAAVKRGDPLMIIGQPANLRGELRVSEKDIQDVKPGAKGNLAITSLPQEKFPFTVERIVPSTEVKDAGAHFRVIVNLEKANPIWMPGMEGEARVDVRPRPLIWQWTHRVVDFIRLKLWI